MQLPKSWNLTWPVPLKKWCGKLYNTMEDKRKKYVKAIALLSPSQFIYFLVIPFSSLQVLSCVHTQVNWFHPRARLKNYNSDDRIPFLGDLLKFRASLYILGNAGWLCKKEKNTVCSFCSFVFSILYPETISYYYSFKENLVAAAGEINEQNKTCNQPFFIYWLNM